MRDHELLGLDEIAITTWTVRHCVRADSADDLRQFELLHSAFNSSNLQAEGFCERRIPCRTNLQLRARHS
jgi:hypothetical protein